MGRKHRPGQTIEHVLKQSIRVSGMIGWGIHMPSKKSFRAQAARIMKLGSPSTQDNRLLPESPSRCCPTIECGCVLRSEMNAVGFIARAAALLAYEDEPGGEVSCPKGLM